MNIEIEPYEEEAENEFSTKFCTHAIFTKSHTIIALLDTLDPNWNRKMTENEVFHFMSDAQRKATIAKSSPPAA